MYNISLERCYSSASAHVCCINIHAEMTEILQGKDWSFIFSVAHSFWQSVHVFSLNIHIIWPINRTKWWIIKVKHPSSDIYRKNISLMKINNIILVLRTRIILLSSFVIYFFCKCHSGRFPIVIGEEKLVFFFCFFFFKAQVFIYYIYITYNSLYISLYICVNSSLFFNNITSISIHFHCFTYWFL